MNELLSTHPDSNWEHIAPHLDESAAWRTQRTRPRRSITPLFQELRLLRTIGAILGVSDDAAQKTREPRCAGTITRITSLNAALPSPRAASTVVISANAVHAAPVGLAPKHFRHRRTYRNYPRYHCNCHRNQSVIAMTALQKTIVTATLTVS